jgi:CRISPR/Cas system-associated exonuclease Cas4 (RecB family)
MTVVFSASSVNTYQMCHLQWWFAYVAAIPTEPSEPQAVGIAVHDYAERVLKGDKDMIGLVYVKDTSPLLAVFDRDILPTYENVLLIEESFQIDVNGIPFSGVIDTLDQHVKTWGKENILRDLKTTGKRPSAGKYRYNMVGYYLGVTEGLGHHVTAMQLDYIVRTKTPYYLPEVQPIPDQQEIEGWAAQLELVANYVEDGDFQPTGLGSYVCNFCNYRDMCGPYQRFKERAG